MTTCAGAAGTGIRCSGHGRCLGATNHYKCECDDEFEGHDCRDRKCPMGRAWFEEPQVDEIAHFTSVPCSNAVRDLSEQDKTSRCTELTAHSVSCAAGTLQSNGLVLLHDRL